MSYCHTVHSFPSAFQKQQIGQLHFCQLHFCFTHEVLFRAIEWSWTQSNQSSMSSLEHVTVAPIFPTTCCWQVADVGFTDRDKTCHSSQTACIEWPCALCALAQNHSLRSVVSFDLLQ